MGESFELDTAGKRGLDELGCERDPIELFTNSQEAIQSRIPGK